MHEITAELSTPTTDTGIGSGSGGDSGSGSGPVSVISLLHKLWQ